MDKSNGEIKESIEEKDVEQDDLDQEDIELGDGYENDYDYDDFDDYAYDEDPDVIYLTLDDGSEIECNVIGIFEVDGREYISLIPMGEEQVLLYKYDEYDDGVDLTNIEDENEFDTVSEVFYNLYLDDLDDFTEDDYEFENEDE